MNRRMIMRILGFSLMLEGGLMLLPALCAVVYGESPFPMLISAFAAFAAGFILRSFQPKDTAIFARDGFTAVSLVWILMSAFGALPFVLSGDIPSYTDAFFETVSGFTTTGATVLKDVEALSRSGLFWRSFTHWIGGMGVLVFMMAVLPMSGEHSMHIMRAEVPGPVVGKLVPRVRDTAKILYIIYTVLTAVETVLLMLGGMSFFEALLHAFGTAGTGGFSTRNASIAAFDSLYIEMVIGGFLVLFGINFNLYYLILIGNIKEALKNEELHVYFGLIAAAVCALAFGIRNIFSGSEFRYAFFNTITILSTAGYGTADFTLWPLWCQSIIVLLMFVGGCAGSTGGGMKLSRVMLLFKNAAADISRTLSPRRVKRVKMDGKCVDSSVTASVSAFFFLYMAVILLCTFITSFDGYDLTTSFTASLSCISNIGPGLGLVGPAGNFSIFSAGTKLFMAFTMLLGRLEIYPLLILLTPSRRRK